MREPRTITIHDYGIRIEAAVLWWNEPRREIHEFSDWEDTLMFLENFVVEEDS